MTKQCLLQSCANTVPCSQSCANTALCQYSPVPTVHDCQGLSLKLNVCPPVLLCPYRMVYHLRGFLSSRLTIIISPLFSSGASLDTSYTYTGDTPSVQDNSVRLQLAFGSGVEKATCLLALNFRVVAKADCEYEYTKVGVATIKTRDHRSHIPAHAMQPNEYMHTIRHTCQGTVTLLDTQFFLQHKLRRYY